MENFTPIDATMGGILIGVSASLVYFWLGKIAGISGIIGSLVQKSSDSLEGWKITFIIGLIISPYFWFSMTESPLPEIDASLPMLIIGGLLVGFGTSLGRGCTSGHGICGISRLSIRSILATGLFMAVAIATVFVIQHVIGS